ncbi:MAG: hypothetical protein U0W24_16095 [Bacteroidales bacterium]
MEGAIIYDSEFIGSLYTNSFDTIIIDNQNLILQTELYRDFFPGGPINQNDTRLIAPIYIVNIDSSLISKNFKVSKLYVINNDQAWMSVPEYQTDIYLPEYKAFWISTNGPKWETGIFVDVIVSIKDLTNDQDKLLISRNQIIEKVE